MPCHELAHFRHTSERHARNAAQPAVMELLLQQSFFQIHRTNMRLLSRPRLKTMAESATYRLMIRTNSSFDSYSAKSIIITGRLRS
jgi:hypothetical protein